MPLHAEVVPVFEKLKAAVDALAVDYPEWPVRANCELMEDEDARKVWRWVWFELVALDDGGEDPESILDEALERVGLQSDGSEYGFDDEGRQILAVTGSVDL